MLILQPCLMGFIQSQEDPHQINHPKGNGENDKRSHTHTQIKWVFLAQSF